MRMNISVPDALAEEVRRRELPISAICQRALRDELTRAQVIERAEDIQVFIESEQKDPDPATWAGFDPEKPHLIHGHHPGMGDGWTLWYPLGDEMDDHFINGDPDKVDWALRQARDWLRIVRGTGDTEMGRITVDVGEPAVTVAFTGRWLVEPDSDETRSAMPGHDAGAYWGVALTRRGRIAVYTAHCNERWAPSLNDFDSLDAAAGVPADIIARAAAELGEQRVLWRDI